MSEAPKLAPPPEPESIEEAGISETTLEHLILKILYFRGELYGQDLSNAIGLKFSVIQEIIESLKIQFQVVVKRSLGMGSVGSVLALTEAGFNTVGLPGLFCYSDGEVLPGLRQAIELVTPPAIFFIGDADTLFNLDFYRGSSMTWSLPQAI